LPSRFYVCPWAGGVRPWNPPEPLKELENEQLYFGRVLQEMERCLEVDGLTFYLTWNTRELPSYGPDVVALLNGDELCRIPDYSHRVCMVFKCYGTRPYVPLGRGDGSAVLNALVAAKYLQSVLAGVSGAAKRVRARLRAGSSGGLPPIVTIPLGYHNQVELPLEDIRSRSTDVSFAGSVRHEETAALGIRGRIGTPKTRSREAMLASLRAFADKRPGLRISINETAGFVASHSGGAEAYSRSLMSTKICLVPRGNSVETFRLFEALRAGCVVVHEPLPPHWFYQSLPGIALRDWRRLPRVLDDLLADESRLVQLHAAGRRWWDTVASEAAVGAFMADRLNADG
jgi:hypothetical protein